MLVNVANTWNDENFVATILPKYSTLTLLTKIWNPKYFICCIFDATFFYLFMYLLTQYYAVQQNDATNVHH